MKIEKKLLPKSIIELTIEESADNIAKYRKKAITYLSKNADINWFRKWANIPENVIVKHYWDEHINAMTVESAIDDLYREALKKEKIMPVAQAEISEVVSQSPLIFKAKIEVFPEIVIDKKYKEIKLKKASVSVSQEEVKNALSEIEKKFTTFKESIDAKDKVENLDRVTIDTTWYDEKWNELETTQMIDYPLIIGSNILVPGFEEKLIWSVVLDKLELDIPFPKDYHNIDFAWKNIKFNVAIKKIEKPLKPEFTPDFIEQLRGKKLDLDWFKDLIKAEILDTKESNTRMDEEHKLIDELLKITKIDLWDWMLKNQTEKVINEIKENIAKDGMKMSDYLESLKLSEEGYKEKNVKWVAEKRLQWELILHKLYELEKTEVKDEELDEEIKSIMSKFDSKDVLERLKTLYVPWTKQFEELRQRMAYRKLIDSFFE